MRTHALATHVPTSHLRTHTVAHARPDVTSADPCTALSSLSFFIPDPYISHEPHAPFISHSPSPLSSHYFLSFIVPTNAHLHLLAMGAAAIFCWRCYHMSYHRCPPLQASFALVRCKGGKLGLLGIAITDEQRCKTEMEQRCKAGMLGPVPQRGATVHTGEL